MSTIPTTITREPIKVIANIIQTELGLGDGFVMLDYEKNFIPTTQGLYVALAYGDEHPIGNNNYSVPVPEGMTEIQEVSMLHEVVIDALSFNEEARVRKEEIIAALNSVYSQGAQQSNLMSIARIPRGFVNASSLEETKRLNRFVITVTVTALHRKVKPVSYYDQFRDPEVQFNG